GCKCRLRCAVSSRPAGGLSSLSDPRRAPRVDVAQHRGRAVRRVAAWYNSRAHEERVSFNGLDLYSLNTSIHAVLRYFDDGYRACERDVAAMLSDMLRSRAGYSARSASALPTPRTTRASWRT